MTAGSSSQSTVDGVGGVARLAARLGDDHRDGLADIAHRLLRERRKAPIFIGLPSFDLIIQPQIRLPMPSAASSAPVSTPTTPGIAFAAAVSMLADLRVRVRRADEGRVVHARHAHVVGVAAAAGDEALVFLAGDACADSFDAHRCSSPDSLAAHAALPGAPASSRPPPGSP